MKIVTCRHLEIYTKAISRLSDYKPIFTWPWLITPLAYLFCISLDQHKMSVFILNQVYQVKIMAIIIHLHILYKQQTN